MAEHDGAEDSRPFTNPDIVLHDDLRVTISRRMGWHLAALHESPICEIEERIGGHPIERMMHSGDADVRGDRAEAADGFDPPQIGALEASKTIAQPSDRNV